MLVVRAFLAFRQFPDLAGGVSQGCRRILLPEFEPCPAITFFSWRVAGRLTCRFAGQELGLHAVRPHRALASWFRVMRPSLPEDAQDVRAARNFRVNQGGRFGNSGRAPWAAGRFGSNIIRPRFFAFILAHSFPEGLRHLGTYPQSSLAPRYDPMVCDPPGEPCHDPAGAPFHSMSNKEGRKRRFFFCFLGSCLAYSVHPGRAGLRERPEVRAFRYRVAAKR
jgi:hypothetical protein